MAGVLGGAPHLLGAQPVRPAERRLRADGRTVEAVRARHVPVRERGRAPRRPSPRLHRHRRVRALPTDERPQRAACDGLRRVRSARGAVCDADRSAAARHHRGQHREHAPAVARAGPRARSATRPGNQRRRLLPVDPVDLSPDLQRLVRRQGRRCTTHCRVGGSARVRRARRRRTAVGRARPDREAAARRLVPARIPRRGARQLVSRAGHGARERGGDARRRAASAAITRCSSVR